MPSSNSVKFMLCNVRKPEQFTLRRPDGKEYSLTTEAATQVIDALLNTELPDMKSCLYPRKFGFLTAELSYGGVAGHGGDAMLKLKSDFKQLRDYNMRLNCIGRWDPQRCLINLAAGKCKDTFIRETVGKFLFPEHYNSKQRQ